METPPRQLERYPFNAIVPTTYVVDEAVRMEGSIALLKAAESATEGAVVLKMPLPHAPYQSKHAIWNEARVLSQVQHPSIVRMIELVDYEHILVLERLGTSLESYLEENGQPCMRAALEMMQQMLEGLLALHTEGFVHCDLAARNVLFKDGKLVLIDFDVAREVGETCAKIRNCPFEEMEADPAMDIFKLGLVMCRIFFKSLPESPYKDFIDMFLADDPRERPTAAVALQGTIWALQPLLEDERKRMTHSKRKFEEVYSNFNVVHSNMNRRRPKKRVKRA